MNDYARNEMVRMFGAYLGRQQRPMRRRSAPYTGLRKSNPQSTSLQSLMINLGGNIASSADVTALAQRLGISEILARQMLGMRGYQLR